MVPLKLDISDVGMSNGDYSAGEIDTALEPYLRQIVHEIAENYADRKTVVFLPLVHIFQIFCDLLNEMGVPAAEVNGNSADRANILRDFESGRCSVLCNSMLVTEGWDCPAVDCMPQTQELRPYRLQSVCPLENALKNVIPGLRYTLWQGGMQSAAMVEDKTD